MNFENLANKHSLFKIHCKHKPHIPSIWQLPHAIGLPAATSDSEQTTQIYLDSTSNDAINRANNKILDCL